MYEYRKLTAEQKEEVLRQRRLNGYPLHSPPHLYEAEGWFLITAATYEHKHYFTAKEVREWLLEELFKELGAVNVPFAGWVILPNHYHLLVRCSPLATVSEPLRRAHARTARELNRRDNVEGRQVWYRFSDRLIRDERHYYTTLNYIHSNPIKHGYVKKALDWDCTSAHWYAEHLGMDWLRDTWHTHPVRDYGKDWDEI